eukprot:716202-Prorocentrum_minimum.AAC.2
MCLSSCAIVNNGSRAATFITFDAPFASGTFRNAFKAKYTDGARKGAQSLLVPLFWRATVAVRPPGWRVCRRRSPDRRPCSDISPTLGNFGPTDLGKPGMTTFFRHHRCNKYCAMAISWPSTKLHTTSDESLAQS